MEKLPPIAKVYEAWSAVADGRVVLHPNERCATVASSNAQKEYTVTWDEADAVYSSNDNATYWQGYAGYPVIAVLMAQGRLPFDNDMAEGFAHVDWTELNERQKRDYAAAVREVVDERGLDAAQADAAAHEVLDALAALDVTVKRGAARPPRAKSKEA